MQFLYVEYNSVFRVSTPWLNSRWKMVAVLVLYLFKYIKSIDLSYWSIHVCQNNSFHLGYCYWLPRNNIVHILLSRFFKGKVKKLLGIPPSYLSYSKIGKLLICYNSFISFSIMESNVSLLFKWKISFNYFVWNKH